MGTTIKIDERKCNWEKLNISNRDPKICQSVISDLAGKVRNKEELPIDKFVPRAAPSQ